MGWDGTEIKKPTALATLGRDVYVSSIDRLGYATAVLMNAKEMIGQSSLPTNIYDSLIKACGETAAVVMNGETRQNIRINGKKPADFIGQDLFSNALVNATVDIDPKTIWVGTRVWGAADLGLVMSKKDNGKIGVSLSVEATNLDSLSTQIRRAKSIAQPGLPKLTLEPLNI